MRSIAACIVSEWLLTLVGNPDREASSAAISLKRSSDSKLNSDKDSGKGSFQRNNHIEPRKACQ